MQLLKFGSPACNRFCMVMGGGRKEKDLGCFNLCNEYGHANVVMDACHHVAELFSVCGTREVADGIGWSRCVISPLLFRPVKPAAP